MAKILQEGNKIVFELVETDNIKIVVNTYERLNITIPADFIGTGRFELDQNRTNGEII